MIQDNVGGIPLHRACDEYLVREYLALQKASFDRVFGHNAERQRKIVGSELIRRGITSIPNIFGAIPVKV